MTWLTLYHLDGNTSFLSTTNGMSSEGVGPTGGQYGSVLPTLSWSSMPPANPSLIFSLGRFIPLPVLPHSWP